MVQKIIIYDDSPQGPPPGASAAGRLIAFVVMIAIAFSVYCVVAKQNPLSGLGAGSAEAAPEAGNTQLKMLAEARKFDDLRYEWGGGHNPKQWVANYKKGKVGGLDCSGLVDVAVYIVTNGKINSWQVAEGFQKDKNWKTYWTDDGKKDFGSPNQMQPGDIVWRNPGHRGSIAHVGIVMENYPGSDKVKIFEAKSSRLPRDQQIRVSTYPYSDFRGASRLKFKG